MAKPEATETKTPRQAEGFFASAAATVKAVQGAVGDMQDAANSRIDKVAGPLLADGMLAAAFRQGAGEFYEALKPFPQSLQVSEPGTLMSPTQGEIAEARDEKLPTLSEIAAGKALTPPQTPNVKQAQQENQKDMGMSM